MKIRFLPLLVGYATIVLAGTIGCTERSKNRMAKDLNISVEDVADEAGMHNKLVVESNGSTTYIMRSNSESKESREIGQYAIRLDEDRLSKVHKVFEGPEFRNMADHWGQVESGEATRLITLRQGDVESRKFISMERTAPSNYEPVKKAIGDLVEELKKHPVRVLRVDIQWPGNLIQRDKRYPITVTFINPGAKKALFWNPFAKKRRDNSKLGIRAQRSDVDIMALREHHYIRQDITRENAKRVDKNLPLDQTFIELSPGSSVLFPLDIAFDWPPGEYLAQLVWEDYVIQKNEDVLNGVLFSTKQSIRVEGVSKLGDERSESEGDASDPDEEDDGR